MEILGCELAGLAHIYVQSDYVLRVSECDSLDLDAGDCADLHGAIDKIERSGGDTVPSTGISILDKMIGKVNWTDALCRRAERLFQLRARIHPLPYIKVKV